MDTNVKFRNGNAQAGPYIKFKGCEMKYLAKFAQDHFNYDELEVTLETRNKDMCIIYEIIENYLSRKPAQISTPQTQQPPAHSRPAPNLPPKTAFQASPSPPNVSN